MFREVCQERLRIFSNVAEIDTFTTALKQEQTVKVLEQASVRSVEKISVS
jgi:hypothetical protein